MPIYDKSKAPKFDLCDLFFFCQTVPSIANGWKSMGKDFVAEERSDVFWIIILIDISPLLVQNPDDAGEVIHLVVPKAS